MMPLRLRRALTPLWLLSLLPLLASLPALAGTVSIANRTVLPLSLSDAEGQERGSVAPGATLKVELPEGIHRLTAHRPGGAPYATLTVNLGATGGPTWEILPNEGSIEVRNLSTAPLTLFVDGQPLLDVAPNDTASVHGLRPGKRAVRAVSGDQVLALAVADVEPNGTWVWRLSQSGLEAHGAPVLRVANFAGAYIDVYVNGEKRSGVFPGDSVAVGALPPGKITLEARGAGGEVLQKETLTPTPGQAQRWVVAGPDGGRAVVEILNQRAEALRICVDGAYCLRVDAGATLQYDGIRPGSHTLQAYPLKGEGLLKSKTLDLAIGHPYRWVVEAPQE